MAEIRTRYKRLDTPNDFLLALMEKHELRSYERAAAFLGVKRQTVYNYRDNVTGFDGAICEKIAAGLEIPTELVLAKMAGFRAATDEERAAWHRTAELIRKAGFKVLAALGVGAVLSAAPTPPAEATSHNADVNTHCTGNRRRQGGRASWSFAALVARLAMVSL